MDTKALLAENARLKKQLQKKDKELYSIQRIGKALGSTLNIDMLLKLIMQEITTLMDADRSTLYILDHERKELWAKIALKAEVKEIRQKIGRGISGHVAATGETINIPDAYQNPRFDPKTDRKTGFTTRSMLCMPVWQPHPRENQQQIIGVIQVLNKKDNGVFTEEDEDLLEALASQVAISIENARLYTRLEKKLREIDLLYIYEQILNSENSLPRVLEKLLRKTVEHLKARWIWALLPNNGQPILVGVNNKRQIRVDESKKIPALSSFELMKNPSRKALVKYWRQMNRQLELYDDFEFPDRAVLYSKVETKADFPGLLFAVDVKIGEALNYIDERIMLDLLAQKVSRAFELHSLRESLLKQERLSAIGQMMSTVAHDIRSPVSTINGFVDLMEDESTTSSERGEFAEIIRDEIRSTINMITEVLDFAKGKTSILPRKTGVRSIVKRFRTRLEQMCKEKSTKLTIEETSKQIVYVDEEKINRVFYNIAKNALEAMGSGGKLHFRVYDETDMVVFQFTDNGPGIPRDIRDRLFDSFVTSGKKSGTGLGLAIVKKIIDEHKGRILIESPPEGGATFRIKLPVFGKHLNK